MTKHKKINTLDLIQQMAEKNKETIEVLESIRNVRSPSPYTDIEQHLEPKDVRKEAGTNISIKADLFDSEGQSKNQYGVLKRLKVLLTTETFRDKKETFTLSLSGDCLGKYEKLANGTSYKLGIKTTRNDFIRKVLEDYIAKKYENLTRSIDQN